MGTQRRRGGGSDSLSSSGPASRAAIPSGRLSDVDLAEAADWLEVLETIIEPDGPERARGPLVKPYADAPARPASGRELTTSCVDAIRALEDAPQEVRLGA